MNDFLKSLAAASLIPLSLIPNANAQVSIPWPGPGGAAVQGGGGGAVTYVTQGTINTAQTSFPATDTSLTIPSGTNQTLVMFVTTVANVTPTVSWNGTSMGTAVEATYDGATSSRLSIFCLANPAVGNNTTLVSGSSTPLQLDFVGVVFSNTHQAAPCSGGVSVTPDAVSASVNVSGTANGMAVAMSAGGAVISMTGNTIYALSSQPFTQPAAQYTAVGASSGVITQTFTAASSGNWHAVGLNILAGP